MPYRSLTHSTFRQHVRFREPAICSSDRSLAARSQVAHNRQYGRSATSPTRLSKAARRASPSRNIGARWGMQQSADQRPRHPRQRILPVSVRVEAAPPAIPIAMICVGRDRLVSCSLVNPNHVASPSVATPSCGRLASWSTPGLVSFEGRSCGFFLSTLARVHVEEDQWLT